MKTYEWVEPFYSDDSNTYGISVRRLTENEILKYYWATWYKLMIKKFKTENEFFTKEECIKDFVVIHWATEIPSLDFEPT